MGRSERSQLSSPGYCGLEGGDEVGIRQLCCGGPYRPRERVDIPDLPTRPVMHRDPLLNLSLCMLYQVAVEDCSTSLIGAQSVTSLVSDLSRKCWILTNAHTMQATSLLVDSWLCSKYLVFYDIQSTERSWFSPFHRILISQEKGVVASNWIMSGSTIPRRIVALFGVLLSNARRAAALVLACYSLDF